MVVVIMAFVEKPLEEVRVRTKDITDFIDGFTGANPFRRYQSKSPERAELIEALDTTSNKKRHWFLEQIRQHARTAGREGSIPTPTQILREGSSYQLKKRSS